MKRSAKIILAIGALALAGVSYYGYQVYQLVAGSEPLQGNQGAIPPKPDEIPPVTQGTADWPNWRGRNFDGKNASTGMTSNWSSGLKKVWEVDFLCQDKGTASWSAPVIQGNRLIVPGRDEKNDLVFCLNADNGSLIWHGSYEAEAASSHGPGSRATAFIDDNRVYTFGRSGDLVCWTLEDGRLLWRQNVKQAGGIEPSWGYSTSPLVIDEKVIVQGGGTALVVAYNKQTGQLLWKSMEGEAGYAATLPLIIGNEKKLLVYHGTGLSCLNPGDGKELWTVPWPTKYFVNATTPIIKGDTIFHSSGYQMGCQAIKVNSSGYLVIWTNKALEAQHSDPILIDGYIYGYSGESARNNGQFKCIELSSGKEMWSSNEIGQGTCTWADGYLFCQNIKGDLFLIQPQPEKFIKLGEIKNALPLVKNPAWTVPVIANGKLYLRYMQHLVCYQLN